MVFTLSSVTTGVKKRDEGLRWGGSLRANISCTVLFQDTVTKRMRSWSIFGITTCMLNGIPSLKIFFVLSEEGNGSCEVGLLSCRPQSPPHPPGNLCQMQERMSKVFKVDTQHMGGNILATRKPWIISTTLSTWSGSLRKSALRLSMV